MQILLKSAHTKPSLLSPPLCCRKLLLHSQGAHGGDLGLVVRAGRARDVPGQAVGTQLQEQQKAGHPQRGLPQVQAGPGTPGRRPQNTHEGKHCEVHGSVGRSAEQVSCVCVGEFLPYRLWVYLLALLEFSEGKGRSQSIFIIH